MLWLLTDIEGERIRSLFSVQMKRRALVLAAHIASICALAMALLWKADGANAQSPNRVALVIRRGDGTASTQCIEFTEPEITGLDVLSRSGLNVVTTRAGMGDLICKIGADGCDNPSRCLCECRGASCTYWSYWHLVDGTWQYSNLGASLYVVRPGTVEGWVWGEGSMSNAPQPPLVTFEEVCLSAKPTPSPLPTESPTDRPAPTDTLVSTSTPGAVHTPTPEPTPASTPPTATRTATAVPISPTRRPGQPATLTPPFAVVTEVAAVQTKTYPPSAVPVYKPSLTPQTGGPSHQGSPSQVATDAPAGSNYVAFAGVIAVLAVTGIVVWWRSKAGT